MATNRSIFRCQALRRHHSGWACHTVLCACVRRSLHRGSSQGCCTDILPPTADWASGGLSISIPCPRPQSCAAPAGGAGSGEKHKGVDLATSGPAPTGAGGSANSAVTVSALRLDGLYTPRPQCCPSSLTHADHSIWAESVVEPGLLSAVLTHLYETRPLSQTRDRSRLSPRRPPPTPWWRRLWFLLRGASLCL